MINDQITAKEVRLVGADGEALGVMPLSQATTLADDAGLDLVMISPVANPPVCKIMDYGKYRFDTLKREKEAKKKQKVVEVKGMQLSMNIQDNDLNIKAKNVRKMLEGGDKVKVNLRMHGRQIANAQSMGLPMMQKFFDLVSDIAEMQAKPEINGRQIIMVLSPKK